MSSDSDVTRAVRAWLEEGATVFPDRLLDEVLDQLPATPQRSRWPARWFPVASRAVGVGVAVAAVVVGAVVVGLVRPQNVGGPAVPEASATASPTSSELPRLNYQPSLDAGTYIVRVPQPLDVTVTVPDGWRAEGDWAVTGPNGAGLPAGMAIGFWEVANVYADPLRPELGEVQPPVGPTVDDLVVALLRQPGYSSVSDPIDVTVDGYTGRQLELTVRSDVEFQSCTGNQFLIWRDTAGGDRCAQGPGQIERVVILDVEGERLVIDVVFFPATPAADRVTLEQVFNSIQIEPRYPQASSLAEGDERAAE